MSKFNKKRGNALITITLLLGFMVLSGGSYLNRSVQEVKNARRQSLELQTTQACESGVQALLLSYWRPFKVSQNFTAMDAALNGASIASPQGATSSALPGQGYYSAAVISYTQVDSYTRQIVVRCTGFIDTNNNQKLDSTEPFKLVDVTATFALARSKVFDYSYFINNFGWMDGFGANDLIVNGDMRANGNFSFTNGTPTVNGTVVACPNDKLIPAVNGSIIGQAVKQSDSNYISSVAANTRARRGYDSSYMGDKNSATYKDWRDWDFESSASIVNQAVDGATLSDVSGTKSWDTSNGFNTSVLDPTPTQEVIMPDLDDITRYQTMSQNYVDLKQTYVDGTANPNYNTGAYLKYWNGTAYVTATTNGIVSGSVAVIGDSTHPILIHGPVTINQDCVIKGQVSGQGTIYTGRNVHIVGSIKYQTPPNFTGTNLAATKAQNEKADMLGLAARGSIIMGDTSTFGGYPLNYMTPPFTHSRLDDNGNTIAAYNANAVDSTGFKKYQSVFGDTYIHSVSSGVNQIDAVMYTNLVGGGDLGTSGGGCTINGSIISKDEAMVLWSLPMKMNYDGRIKELSLSKQPLIDIALPRSPQLTRNAWQDRGFYFTPATVTAAIDAHEGVGHD